MGALTEVQRASLAMQAKMDAICMTRRPTEDERREALTVYAAAAGVPAHNVDAWVALAGRSQRNPKDRARIAVQIEALKEAK